MANVSLNVSGPFHVQEMALDNGERFLVFRAEPHNAVSMILPGHDYAAAATARGIAEKLIEAANALEDVLDAQRPEPAVDDGGKACPECDRPNQFGEVCSTCEAERVSGTTW